MGNRARWIVVLLSITLLGGVAAQAQSQSKQNISAQVAYLLAAFEDSDSTSQWRSLGDAAVPILESVVADSNSPPTRRARALVGLAALSAGSATMQRVANSPSEPLMVRSAAVNGLVQLLPESDLIPALRPLLNDPQYKMRGITAQALSNTLAGCAEIAGMAHQETPAWRSRYARNCAHQANSEQEPPEPSRPVVDYFAVATVANLVDPSGNQVGTAPPLGPPGNNGVFWGLLGGFSRLVPYSPTLPFASGQWTFDFGASPGDTVDVQALIKTAPPFLSRGKIDFNFFFVGVPGLTAASAPTDPNFQAIVSKVRSIYAQIGLDLGTLTYIDILGADQVSFEILGYGPTDLARLVMLSNHPKARPGAINMFFVDFLAGGGAGIDPGVPGLPVRGTPGSGAVVGAGSFPSYLDEIAVAVAHETGHWLGLYHTTEFSGTVFDPLPDTPQCPQINSNLFQCPDANNVMFPFLVSLSPVLTPDQQFVMLRNPVVSQPPGSEETEDTEEHVSSIPLGSYLVPSTYGVGPITVNVPPNAVSMELIGTATFTPKTIRVPQDFPTIQLAVNNAHPLDTIQVGAGRWCGADITAPLKLVGQGGATIMGCPPGVPSPYGSLRRRGFRIEAFAAGTSISNLVFDGVGASVGGTPLFYGIEALPGADDLLIDSNTFLGTAYAIVLGDGKNYQITHDVFEGFTVMSDGEGGAAILMIGDTGQFKGNSIRHNRIRSTVPAGDFSAFSWVAEADVPLAGIVVSGQDGAIISNNHISITANSHGDGGAGIIATDNIGGFTTTNLSITNNDGRDSAYALIIAKDLNGGTGNSVGAWIAGNLGLNLIDGVTYNVTSSSTVLVCDPLTGVCH